MFVARRCWLSSAVPRRLDPSQNLKPFMLAASSILYTILDVYIRYHILYFTYIVLCSIVFTDAKNSVVERPRLDVFILEGPLYDFAQAAATIVSSVERDRL